MSSEAYNSTIAARTRAAAQILETPDLLAKFIEAGGAEAVRNGEPPELIAKLKGILANETEVSVSVVEEKDEAGNIEVKRKVKKSDAQEAIRMEIAKDSDALLSFSDILPRLDERRVTAERLSTLKSRADSLAGMLADRATAKNDLPRPSLPTTSQRRAVSFIKRDAPLINGKKPRAELLGEIKVVRGDHCRRIQVAQNSGERAFARRIESGRGLIEKEQ